MLRRGKDPSPFMCAHFLWVLTLKYGIKSCASSARHVKKWLSKFTGFISRTSRSKSYEPLLLPRYSFWPPSAVASCLRLSTVCVIFLHKNWEQSTLNCMWIFSLKLPHLLLLVEVLGVQDEGLVRAAAEFPFHPTPAPRFKRRLWMQICSPKKSEFVFCPYHALKLYPASVAMKLYSQGTLKISSEKFKSFKMRDTTKLI